MKETVLITQLYKASKPDYIMATCHIRDSEDGDRFECKIFYNKVEKEQLWQFVSGNWKGLTGEVEFNDVNSVGLPKDAVITHVNGFTPVNF